MPDAIIDGRGSGNAWGVNENNEGLVTLRGSGTNPLAHYLPAERDMSSTTLNYNGFVDRNNNWYIIRQSGASSQTTSYRYAQGGSEFETNWTNRASLSYGIAGSVF